MDLFKLSKKALENPLDHRNFIILFVFSFIVLVSGLTFLSIIGLLYPTQNPNSSCELAKQKTLAGKAVKDDNTIYDLTLGENSNCTIEANIKASGNSTLSLWVYDPDGKIEVIRASGIGKVANFLKTSPLSSGKWRFVVKTDGNETAYEGVIAVK